MTDFIPPALKFKGNKERAISLKSQAAKFYNKVSRDADREGLPFISRSQILPDGSLISVIASKQSNYNNTAGVITITTPRIPIGKKKPEGGSPYISVHSSTTVKPSSSIFSNTSFSPLTGDIIDTTAAFAERFGPPYQVIQDPVYQAVEVTDAIKNLPRVDRVCNSIKYDELGNPIVYTGLTNPVSIPNLGPAFLSYLGVKYIHSQSYIIFDVFLKGTNLFILSGNRSNIYLYSIDTASTVGLKYSSFGSLILSMSMTGICKYTLFYTDKYGEQSIVYNYTTGASNTNLIDAKFAPEFGRITFLKQMSRFGGLDYRRTVVFDFDLVQDMDFGGPTIDYWLPTNISKAEYYTKYMYHMQERLVTNTSNSSSVTSSTRFWRSIGLTALVIVGIKILNMSLNASPVQPLKYHYYHDNIVSSYNSFTCSYANGTFDTYGSSQYTVVPVSAGSVITFFDGYEYGTGAPIFSTVTFNSLSISLTGDTIKIIGSATYNNKGTGPDIDATIDSNIATAEPIKITVSNGYIEVRDREWVDSDQSYIVGISYNKDKESIDYNKKLYIYYGIKENESSIMEFTTQKSTNSVGFYGANSSSDYSLSFFNSPTEFSDKFSDIASYFPSDGTAIDYKKAPSIAGNLIKGYYLGDTFTNSIKLCDAYSPTYYNYGAKIELDIVSPPKLHTFKYINRQILGWSPFSTGEIEHYYAQNYSTPYMYAVTKRESYSESPIVESQQDLSQNFITSDNPLNFNILGYYPEDKLGYSCAYQNYTQYTKIEDTITNSLNRVTDITTYKVDRKVILENKVFKDGIVRSINSITDTPINFTFTYPLSSVLSPPSTPQTPKERAQFGHDSPGIAGHALPFHIAPNIHFINLKPSIEGIFPTAALPDDTTLLRLEDDNGHKIIDILSLSPSTPVTNNITCGYSY